MKRAIQRSLRKRGYNLHRLTDEERQAYERYEQRGTGQAAGAIFGNELEHLQDLRRRYAQVDLPVAIHSVWGTRGQSHGVTDIGWGGVDLPNFRGHSAFVWDYGNASFETTNLKYYLFMRSVRDKDPLGLLQKLTEDGAFGCLTFEYDEVGTVSRDLLDSIVEINFLDKHLGLMERSDLRVLDVGAGYGRMAHRLLEAHPGIQSYTCVDAVPESTFLCEFYVKYRGLEDRARVIPLDELDAALSPDGGYNLAMNIHSFSECTYAAVEWWLRRIADIGVRHLLIVPNDATEFLSLEPDHSRRDYAPLLRELGFEQVACEPVFDDPQVRTLIGVHDNMYLFERT